MSYMTTTQDTTQTLECEEFNCSHDATEDVTAAHFDPDPDDEGRAIGWSRPVSTRLCDDCIADWECDDLVAILERHLL